MNYILFIYVMYGRTSIFYTEDVYNSRQMLLIDLLNNFYGFELFSINIIK